MKWHEPVMRGMKNDYTDRILVLKPEGKIYLEDRDVVRRIIQS
jgi:hypothetical protein